MYSERNKDIHVKAFNTINDCKCKSIVQHVIQIKNGIIKHVNVNVKIIISAKRL